MKMQISEVAYKSIAEVNNSTPIPLKELCYLVIAELNGKYVIIHIHSINEDNGLHFIDGEIKAEYNTQAEAQMSMKAIRVLLNNKGIKTL